MANNNEFPSYFKTIDVSEPTTPRKETEIIQEQITLERKAWITSYKKLIYGVIGIVLVALIALFIYFFYQGTNPMSRLVSSSAKNFGTSFEFAVQMSKNDDVVMRYDGSISVDRSKRSIEALYDAVYTDYSYKAAVYSDGTNAVRGSYLDGKWIIRDDSDKIRDFFDFDTDYRNGGFDSGALLRFTELTSDYSAEQLDELVKLLRDRLSTNSTLAVISSQNTEQGTQYEYIVDLSSVLKLIADEGAPLFYRSSDYDRFRERYLANIDNIGDAQMRIAFTTDAGGYLSYFGISLDTGTDEYSFICDMSSFSEAEVAVPDDFLKAAKITVPAE